MSINKPGLISGRVPVTDYGNLTADRYQFLGLNQAEPSLGPGAANAVLTLGTSNTRVWANSLTLQALSVTGNTNGGNFLTLGNVSAAGNVYANLFFGDGRYISNVYSNANVQVYLEGYTGNLGAVNSITASGNIVSANLNTGIISATGYIKTLDGITAVGNITGGNIDGNNIVGTLITGTLTTAAQPNITSVGILTSLSVSGATVANTLQTTGNAIIGGNLIVNGNTTYINIVDLNVQDPLITLGGGPNGTPLIINDGKDRGVLDEYYTDTTHTAWMGWQNSTGNLIAANNVTVANNIVTINSYGVFQAGQVYATSNVFSAGYITATGNILTGANVLATGRVSATGNVYGNNINATNLNLTGTARIQGDLSVQGNIYATSNISNIAGTSAQFYGTAEGFGALYAGIGSGYNIQPDTITQFSANVNEFAQINLQNINSGNAASSDIVATADNGDNYTYYVDMGIAGSTYDGLSANALGTILHPNDAFLFTIGNGADAGQGGNLVIAAYSPDKSIKLATGGGTDANIVLELSTGNASVNGNISIGANAVVNGNLTVLGNVVSSGNISHTGNIVTGANILVAGYASIGGNITTTGNVLTANNVVAQGFASFTGSIQTSSFITATGNILTGANVLASGYASIAGNISTPANITATGNISTNSNLSVTSNAAVGGNLTVAGITSLNGQLVVASVLGNSIRTDGNISVGNLTATNLIYGSVIGTITNAINVDGNNQPNITTVGTLNALTVSGVTTLTGNVTGGNISITGNLNAGNINSNIYGWANTVTNNAQPNITSVGILSSVSVTANVTSGNVTTGIISATGNITGSNLTGTLVTGTLTTASQPNITSLGTLTSLTTSGALNGNSLNISNNAIISGNLTVSGNINITGNITSITGNSAQFFGNSITGYGALYAGLSSGYANLPSTPLQIATNANTYSQLNQQNINSGSLASSDYVLTADNGTDSTYFADFGIASSTYAYPAYTSIGPNDTYLLGVGANAEGPYYGNSNVVIAASNGDIKLLSGGANTGNVIATISNVGVKVTGTISSTGNIATGANLIVATNASVGGNVTITGTTSLTGQLTVASASGNVISTAGNISGGYLFGNGALLTGIDASSIQNGTSNVRVANNANVTVGVAGTSNIGVFTATGLSVTGVITATGNITGGNILSELNISAVGRITGYDIWTDGNVSAGGNVVANNINVTTDVSVAGNIAVSRLASDIEVTTYEVLADGNVSAGGNVVANNVNVAINISAAGNVTSDYTLSNGAIINNNMTVTGNIIAGNIVANITGTLTNISVAGNVQGGNLITTGTGLITTVSANAVNAAYIGNLGTLLTGTLTTAAQPNVTSVGVLTSLSVSGNTQIANLQTTGNAIIGGNLIVNGNTTYINIVDLNVQDPLISLGGGANGTPLVTNDGKDRGVLDEYYTTAAYTAWMGYKNSTGNMVVASNVSVANNIVTVNQYGTLQVGQLYAGTGISTAGNVNANNVSTGIITATGNVYTPTVQNGGTGVSMDAGYPGYINFFNSTGQKAQLDDGGNLSVVGNVVGANFLTAGLISATGNITGSNLTGTLVTGTLTTAAQPNITSVGTLSSLSVTANVTGGNVTTGIISATGSITTTNGITATGNITGGNISGTNLTGSLTTAAQANITSVGVLSSLSVTANVTSGNVTTGIISATGNITGSNLTGTLVTGTLTTAAQPNITSVGTLTTVTVTGNTQSGNLLTAGKVSAQGNVTGNYIIGDGSLLTNINAGNLVGGYGNANVANYLPTYSGNLSSVNSVTASGNIVSANLTTGIISAIGSITTLAGITATGTITAGNANISGTTNLGTGSTSYLTVFGGATSPVIRPQGNAAAGLIFSSAGTGNYVFNSGSSAGQGINTGLAITGYGQNYLAVQGGGSLQPVTLAANGTDTNINIALTPQGAGNVTTGANVSVGGTIIVASAAGNVISTAGNIKGGYLFGNGALLTGIDATSIQNGNSNVQVAANGNVTFGVAGSSNVVVVSDAGISVAGRIDASSDITGSNLYVMSGKVSATGNIEGSNLVAIDMGYPDNRGNVYAGNVNVTVDISATGNITGNYFVGNGALLTGITTSSDSIGNIGNSSVVANAPDGNVSISADGTANLAVFNMGSMTMLGAYANPNYIDFNVSVVGNVNGMMVGPIAFGPTGNIQVPDGSRIVIL